MGSHEIAPSYQCRCKCSAPTLCVGLIRTNIQLPTVTNETLEILTNHEIIAINQDPIFGTSVTPFRWGINVSYVSITQFS
jgi:hypothetical protein